MGVLDGNHGLIGEVLNQRDLLVSKWPDFRARQSQDADGLSFAQHRNAEYGTETSEPLGLRPTKISGYPHIGDVNDTTFQQRCSRNRATFRLYRNCTDVFD